jgi:hypothetical protein
MGHAAHALREGAKARHPLVDRGGHAPQEGPYPACRRLVRGIVAGLGLRVGLARVLGHRHVVQLQRCALQGEVRLGALDERARERRGREAVRVEVAEDVLDHRREHEHVVFDALAQLAKRQQLLVGARAREREIQDLHARAAVRGQQALLEPIGPAKRIADAVPRGVRVADDDDAHGVGRLGRGHLVPAAKPRVVALHQVAAALVAHARAEPRNEPIADDGVIFEQIVGHGVRPKFTCTR